MVGSAYSTLEPFGPLREAQYAGNVASTIAAFAGKELKKGAKPPTPMDWYPELDPRPERRSASMSVGEKFMLWVKTMKKARVAKEAK